MIKLYCGDSQEIVKDLEIENVIVVTDPPFNIGYHYNSYKDRLKEDDYFNMLVKILGGVRRFAMVHYPEQLYKFAVAYGECPKRVVSWVYNSNTRRQHRDIGFWGIEPDFKKVVQPYKNLNDKRVKALIAAGKKGCPIYDWWNVNQVKNVSKEKTSHPCQMPLEIMKNIIGVLPEEYSILDPFMGSGTTGVACKALGRNFIGIEIDKLYYDDAKARIEKA